MWYQAQHKYIHSKIQYSAQQEQKKLDLFLLHSHTIREWFKVKFF
jgi:hypothetical protein